LGAIPSGGAGPHPVVDPVGEEAGRVRVRSTPATWTG